MPLTPYLRPQATITQTLRQTPAPAAVRRNPIVIGPEYKLMLNDGRETAANIFKSAGASHDYEVTSGVPLDLARFSPVTGTAELQGRNLQALVATWGNDVVELDTLTDNSNLRNVRLAADVAAGTGTLHNNLDGRPVRVGDVLNIATGSNGNATPMRRKVLGLLGVVTPATIPSAATPADDPNVILDTSGDTLGGVVRSQNVAGTFGVVSSGLDAAVFRESGRLVKHESGKQALGDTFTITVTTGGGVGAAVVTITSATTGDTATGVESVGDSGNYSIDITGVGHTDALVISGPSTLPVGAQIVVDAYSSYTILVSDSTISVGSNVYTGAPDVTYVVEITELTGTTATANIYDTAGNEPVLSYADIGSLTNVALGSNGVVLASYDEDEAFVGRKTFLSLSAKSVSDVSFDGFTLDGPAVNAFNHSVDAAVLSSVEVYQVFSGTLGDANSSDGATAPVNHNAADFDYIAGLGLPNSVTGRQGVDHSPFANSFGEVILSYKATRTPGALDGPLYLRSVTEIKAAVGESDQSNWLGRGAIDAFNGNQGRPIYALRTAGDTVADFTEALKRIRSTDLVYALAVLSDDVEVQKLVADHCELLSNTENKNFRRCYVGTDTPGSYVHWGVKPGGGYRQATLAAATLTIEEADRQLSVFTNDDIGSEISILSLGGKYTITGVLSAHECTLDIAINVIVSSPSGVTLTRPDTPEAAALYVIGRSEYIGSRRATNVWADRPTSSNAATGLSEVVQNKFIACEIAGLRCALLPQQGLTMTEIESVTAVPGAYARFTPELLDDVAAAGTMVISQESEGGDVFIRHQLTTEIGLGALAYEDNVGVIVDEVSYAVKDRFRNYIGKRNVTPDTIEAMRIELRALAVTFTQVDIINREIGAPVITFFDENGNETEVTVRQDGPLADTVLTFMLLRVPLPLNRINHYIDVETSVSL